MPLTPPPRPHLRPRHRLHTLDSATPPHLRPRHHLYRHARLPRRRGRSPAASAQVSRRCRRQCRRGRDVAGARRRGFQCAVHTVLVHVVQHWGGNCAAAASALPLRRPRRRASAIVASASALPGCCPRRRAVTVTAKRQVPCIVDLGAPAAGLGLQGLGESFLPGRSFPRGPKVTAAAEAVAGGSARPTRVVRAVGKDVARRGSKAGRRRRKGCRGRGPQEHERDVGCHEQEHDDHDLDGHDRGESQEDKEGRFGTWEGREEAGMRLGELLVLQTGGRVVGVANGWEKLLVLQTGGRVVGVANGWESVGVANGWQSCWCCKRVGELLVLQTGGRVVGVANGWESCWCCRRVGELLVLQTGGRVVGVAN
eukprot:366539-Chlamydomonas_euryale.AAC.22